MDSVLDLDMELTIFENCIILADRCRPHKIVKAVEYKENTAAMLLIPLFRL